jgi:hypothetical protein
MASQRGFELQALVVELVGNGLRAQGLGSPGPLLPPSLPMLGPLALGRLFPQNQALLDLRPRKT